VNPFASLFYRGLSQPLAALRPGCLVLLTLLTFGVQANPWYRVEVMLVAYQDEEVIDHELWPDALDAEPPSAVIYEQHQAARDSYDWWLEARSTAEQKALAEFDFSQRPVADFPRPLTQLQHKLFASKADTINRRRDMQVIWHQAWVEPIQSEDNAIRHPIDVAIRDQLNIQLRGTLQLHVSRYLHINTDLVMQHYALEETPELAALSLPASGNLKADYRSGLLEGAELSLTEPQAAPIRSARIQQSRRMRSNELHYVDHPMLGLVVKVIPVETEADLFPADEQ